MTYLLIGIGGALGAVCRYYLGVVIMRRVRSGFPFGTLVINISGSLLLGFLMNLRLDGLVADWLFWLAGVGFCGAYTTFSTFGHETLQLLVANKRKMALLYVFTSVLFSFFGAWIGLLV